LNLTDLRRTVTEKDTIEVEYEKPEIKDYGDLRELTATAAGGPQSDVPRGTPGPFSIFS
jgi:hypothetical protein